MAHYRLAIALAKQNKSQEAIAQCREALRLQPDFPDARDALKFGPTTRIDLHSTLA